MTWTNQDLRLFHGTLDRHSASILQGIDLNSPYLRRGSDFGKGFYTTTSELQARKWADTLTRKPQNRGSRPAVIFFEPSRDRIAALEGLWFVRGDPSADDYWDLVRHFRRYPPGQDHARAGVSPWDDYVAGPVCWDWKHRKAIDHSDQVSFHTQAAVAVLDGSPKGVLP